MKTRNAKHAATPVRKKQIVEVALACFIETGVGETGIDTICQKAGVSVGSVYYHFGSKEQLAAAIYLEGIRDFQAGYLTALQHQSSTRDGIKAVVAYHLRWVEQNPLWARYLFETQRGKLSSAIEQELEQLDGEFFSQMAQWFRPRVERGELQRLPRDMYATMLVGPCQEFARMFLSGKASSNIAQAEEALADLIWRSIGI